MAHASSTPLLSCLPSRVPARRVSHRAADRADAGEAGRRAARRRCVPLRAEVGRLPRHRVSRRRATSFIQSRDLRPLDRYFPELHDVAARAVCPTGCVVDGEIVIATPRRARLRCAAAAAASGGVARREAGAARRRRRSSRSICWPSTAATCATRRRTSAARCSSELLASVAAADPPDADDARSRAGRRVARAVRRRRPRRRDRQAGGRRLPARQARDDQDQARAHRRLRRRRLPLAQERPGELVGSLLLGLYDEPGRAAARRRDVVVHDGDAQARWRRSWRRCASDALDDIRGASGRRRRSGDGSACPAGRAAGAPARICRGSRCGSSACAR